MKIRPVGAEFSLVDWRTDRLDEANSRFSQIWEGYQKDNKTKTQQFVVSVRFKTCIVMGACPHFTVKHWEMPFYWLQSHPANSFRSLKQFVVWNDDLRSDMNCRKTINPKEGQGFAVTVPSIQFGVFHTDFRLLSLNTFLLSYIKILSCHNVNFQLTNWVLE